MKARTGEDAVASELTYDLRSGEADSLDQMVGDDVRERGDGPDPRRRERPDGRDPRRQVRHTHLPEPGLGPRIIDIATAYDLERYRPTYANRLGHPLLLTAAASEVLAG